MNNDRPKDALTIGGAKPLLKEIYNDKPKKPKQEDRRRFSKIRNIIKRQKKS